jgi:hypothetical protein
MALGRPFETISGQEDETGLVSIEESLKQGERAIH